MTQKITLWTILTSIVLLPILVIPFFEDFVLSSKNLVFFLVAIILMLLFVIKTAISNKIQVSVNSLSLGLFALGGSALLSSLLTNQYPAEQVMGMGGVYLSMVLVAILGGSLLPKGKTATYINIFGVSGAFASVLTLIQLTKFGPSWILSSISGIDIANTIGFNLVGSPLMAAELIGLALVATAVWIFNTKKITQTHYVIVPLMIIGFAINVWISLPGKIATPLRLPFKANWTIALQTLETPRSALIGVGPENFGIAYTIFKPLWLNDTQLWNIEFIQGSNAPLTIVTTMGIVGLIAWVALFWAVVKQTNQHQSDNDAFVPALVTLIVFIVELLFPANVILIFIQAVSLAFFIRAITYRQKSINTEIAINSGSINTKRIGRYAVATLGFVAVGALFYMVIRGYYASYLYLNSTKAYAQKDLIRAYTIQNKAIAINPYVDTYRRSFSMINLQLASALANKTDLTAEEQKQFNQLIERSVNEAKAATILSSNRSSNWYNLAVIYRNLAGVSTDAPQWAVNSYVQAANLNAHDPIVLVELGDMFFVDEQYSQALTFYNQALSKKPDLAAVYYKAANTLVKLESYVQAQTAYQQVLLLLEADDELYITASDELEAIAPMVEEQVKQIQAAQQQQQMQDQMGQGALEDTNSITSQNLNQNNQEIINPDTTPLGEIESDLGNIDLTESNEATPASSTEQ